MEMRPSTLFRKTRVVAVSEKLPCFHVGDDAGIRRNFERIVR